MRARDPHHPTGPGLPNDFGLHVEQIGVQLPGHPHHAYRRAWKGGRLMGRVIDRTDYPPEGRVNATSRRWEAQVWDGKEYDPDGFICRSFNEALELIA